MRNARQQGRESESGWRAGGLAAHAIAKALLRDKGSRWPLLSASRLHKMVTKPH